MSFLQCSVLVTKFCISSSHCAFWQNENILNMGDNTELQPVFRANITPVCALCQSPQSHSPYQDVNGNCWSSLLKRNATLNFLSTSGAVQWLESNTFFSLYLLFVAVVDLFFSFCLLFRWKERCWPRRWWNWTPVSLLHERCNMSWKWPTSRWRFWSSKWEICRQKRNDWVRQ